MDQVLTVENIRRHMEGIAKAEALLAKHRAALCALLCAAVKAHGPDAGVPGDVIANVTVPKEPNDD